MKALLLVLAVVLVGCASRPKAESQTPPTPSIIAKPTVPKTASWVSDPSDPDNVKIEKAIRKAAKKPTGELTKADLEKMTVLSLGGNKLTDVTGLEKLMQLTRLDLENNKLTDVKGLEKLTQLKHLYLDNNPTLTKAQIDQLQKALPKCRIHHNARKTTGKLIKDEKNAKAGVKVKSGTETKPLIADPIVEKAIRRDPRKTTGKLIKDEQIANAKATAAGHWPLDEADGRAVKATVGPSGELANAKNTDGKRPERIDGRLGRALRFAGKGEVVAVKPGASLELGQATDFTVALWIRAAKGYTPRTADTILSAEYPGAIWFIALRPGSYNGIYLRHHDGKRAVDIMPEKDRRPQLTDGQWHHVAFTSDRDGTGRVFLDGAPAGEVKVGAVSAAAKYTGLKAFRIGASANDFRGDMDDVAIWRHVLSPVEIRELHAAAPRNVAEVESRRRQALAAADPDIADPIVDKAIHRDPKKSTGKIIKDEKNAKAGVEVKAGTETKPPIADPIVEKAIRRDPRKTTGKIIKNEQNAKAGVEVKTGTEAKPLIADPIVDKAIRRDPRKTTGKIIKDEKNAKADIEVKAGKETKPLIADAIVEKAIRRKLKKSEGELTKADLEKVTELGLYNNQLTDVKSLENLTQLMYLDLGANKLTDVKNLERLTQLKTLHLNNNQLADVTGLEKLTQLEVMWLFENQLTNVKGLENLTQLKKLSLYNNQLTDVTGLEKLTQLKVLWLFENQLTNVKGLEKLNQLTYLSLHSNPDLTKAQIAELRKALPKCRIFSNATK